jgi:hypothetical protein
MAKYHVDTVRWLAGEDTGSSSKAMAFWLAFGVKRRWPDHPHDPSDLGRCIRLLDAAPYLRKRLPEMAELSPVWAEIVNDWSELERLWRHEAECGEMDMWGRREAPLTYVRLKSRIAAGGG